VGIAALEPYLVKKCNPQIIVISFANTETIKIKLDTFPLQHLEAKFFSQLNLSHFQTKNLAFKCRRGSASILILTITVFTKQITNFLRTDFW
jgi:hypothetical protein